MEQLSPQMRQQLAQMQAVQQQAQSLSMQRAQMESQLKEVESTLELLNELAEDAEIYKSSGAILVRSEKGKVSTELNEKKETLELHIKTVKKQEERFACKLKEMQEEVKKAISAAGVPDLSAAG